VTFTDGSTIAQVSPPDMRLPIALALAWPDRVPGAIDGCDWSRATSWEFAPLDADAFPAVELARECGRAGGTAPAVFNAANEECVGAFLAGRLPFTAIVDTVAAVVSDHVVAGRGTTLTLQDVLQAESWARARAHETNGAHAMGDGAG
jgi:1-deoxy-D-xylulose-5-phosphate reductoisomerase